MTFQMRIILLLSTLYDVVLTENMNGEYVVASGAKQNVPFNTDYTSKGHEYFDVYSLEIASHYGDVFWRDQGLLPLPDDIIQRFAGKVIAITGYEHDQVMVQPQSEPGANPDKDVSVPINWAYNHHYQFWFTGNYSTMKPAPTIPQDAYHPTKWIAVDLPSAKMRNDPTIPTKQLFSEGNGGESRKSYHGYPDGYAQLIESPESWHVTPMQVDTRNRECGATINDINNCSQFIAGPEPKQARYGRPIPKAGTNYSGLLECPCNSKFGGDPMFYGNDTKTKTIAHNYVALQSTQCGVGESIVSSTECFSAVLNMGFEANIKIINKIVSDTWMPMGCTMSKSSNIIYVYYNEATKSSSHCSVSNKMSGSTTSKVNVSVLLELDTNIGMINITVSGPANAWFGVGFNASIMADSPYTLIVNSSGAFEQKIGACDSGGDHCPGYELNNTILLLSNTVSNNIRTVIVQRGLIGATKDYYSFVPRLSATINLIAAIGQSQTFSYHKNHSVTSISLIMSTGNTCVCDTGANGKLCESDGSECKTFMKPCLPSPDSSLLAQNNPTCNSKQYSGGLQCCRDGHNLLDKDQEIPQQLLRYHMKFRFWFQEYIGGSTPSHYNLERIYQQTEANAYEYDVPPAYSLSNKGIVGYPNWPLNEATPGTICIGSCPNGTDCQCQHEIHHHWIQSTNKPMRLIYAGGHCHAPSCVSMTLYRNDTGQILCTQIPQYGQGDIEKNKFDESGYVLIPPCLWGNDSGLTPSVLLPPGTPLLSIKKNWNTNMGHYGEMAMWQMRGVFF